MRARYTDRPGGHETHSDTTPRRRHYKVGSQGVVPAAIRSGKTTTFLKRRATRCATATGAQVSVAVKEEREKESERESGRAQPVTDASERHPRTAVAESGSAVGEQPSSSRCTVDWFVKAGGEV